MSARSSITNALVAVLKGMDGVTYTTNVFNNVYAKNKFWNEVKDFPCVYVVPGSELREYLPGGFKWGYISVSLKLYVKGETPEESLEVLLNDVEQVIDANRMLTYETGKDTTEISIISIVTDEGLLAPYGVGEVTLNVRYQVLN